MAFRDDGKTTLAVKFRSAPVMTVSIASVSVKKDLMRETQHTYLGGRGVLALQIVLLMFMFM